MPLKFRLESYLLKAPQPRHLKLLIYSLKNPIKSHSGLKICWKLPKLLENLLFQH